jgi:hypothetical protein
VFIKHTSVLGDLVCAEDILRDGTEEDRDDCDERPKTGDIPVSTLADSNRTGNGHLTMRSRILLVSHFQVTLVMLRRMLQSRQCGERGRGPFCLA